MTVEKPEGQTPDLTEEEQELDRQADESHDDGQGVDPLDEITDPEELRKKAKAYRSTFKKWRGVAKKPTPPAKPADEPKKPEVRVEIPSDVMRKSDMERVATTDAKDILAQTEEGKKILEAYDEIIKIPLAGYDPLNKNSIVQNLKERFDIYRKRNPEKGGKPDTTSIRSISPSKGGGEAPDKAPKIKGPVKPDSWYPKKDPA